MAAITFTSPLPTSAAEAFAWHTRDGAFERLSPPWDNVRVVSKTGDLQDGEVVLDIRQGPFHLYWVARHSGYVEGRQFVDQQVRGPFAHWQHTHRFLDRNPPITEPTIPTSAAPSIIVPSSVLEDDITFALPLGALSRPFEPLVRRMLQRMFAYRHATTRADLARHSGTSRPLRVAVTGASGLVGSSLVPFLTTGGHQVIRLVRRAPRHPDEHQWSPDAGIAAPDKLGHLDAVIHLAGESVAARRWTPAVKARIRNSRVDTTTKLAASLAGMTHPPSTLISASAIGYYGNRGDERLTEHSSPGTGFLADVCQAWEAATQPAAAAGVRVVHARLGVVIDPRGGALKQMLPAFRAGFGGTLGSGRQHFSWISIEDVLGSLLFLLRTPGISGPVNVTAPEAVTNADFTSTLGRVLRRPTLLRVPAFVLSLLYGELAQSEVLASRQVVPDALLRDGFAFLHPTVESSLRHLLGTHRLPSA